MEPEAAPAGKTDATVAQPTPPHDVDESFKGWVLPKLDAVEDKKQVSQFIPIDDLESMCSTPLQTHTLRRWATQLCQSCARLCRTSESATMLHDRI